MNYFEIPLSPIPQVFAISLGGGLPADAAIPRRLDPRRGRRPGQTAGVGPAAGDRLDLLAQHRHLGFAGGLWVKGAESPDDAPTFNDLGRGSHLYWAAE